MTMMMTVIKRWRPEFTSVQPTQIVLVAVWQKDISSWWGWWQRWWWREQWRNDSDNDADDKDGNGDDSNFDNESCAVGDDNVELDDDCDDGCDDNWLRCDNDDNDYDSDDDDDVDDDNSDADDRELVALPPPFHWHIYHVVVMVAWLPATAQ